MVSMSTSSAPSTNLSTSAATLHPSSMPTSASSATTVFPAPPLPYSDDPFYAASAAALDYFDEYGNLGEPSRKRLFDNILDVMASPPRQTAYETFCSTRSNTTLLFTDYTTKFISFNWFPVYLLLALPFRSFIT
ncbi:hypothetical protein C8J57DRAFT_1476503 [Mycena rebaudengoi]|nr:hypothetical protein C8J57DRAFT_1476503 [Mycena rebaudengoi]